MLLYGCFNIDISGPLTQYLKTFPKFSRGAELQPQRASRTLSCPQMRRFGVCSCNANEEERGRVKEEGGGVALSSLHPRYHALRLQWMYCNGEGHTAFSRVLLIF